MQNNDPIWFDKTQPNKDTYQTIKTGNEIIIRNSENFKPKNPISKVTIGILAIDDAARYMKILTDEVPFFQRI